MMSKFITLCVIPLLLVISCEASEVQVDSQGVVEPVSDYPQEADIAMSVTFKNSWSRSVDIYWAQSAADEVLVVPNMGVGQSTTMNTYSNHGFVFAEAGKGTSKLLQSVIMRAGVLQYEITEDSVKASPYFMQSEEGGNIDGCVDKKPHCALSAKRGECERNPGWMIVNCARSCNSCELLNPQVRCDRARLNVSTVPIYQPGDLNKMFESIPSKFSELGVKVVSSEPWIITFDDFMNETETNELINVMNVENGGPGFVRSTDTGAYDAHGVAARVVSQGRTSENAWCRDDCDKNPLIRGIINRIEEVVSIPYENMEQFQILRYSPGQYYRTHHDFGQSQIKLACGPRILTFFLYLSDVEEGGETNFPRLDIAVKPKRGRAVLWPSVMDDDLNKQDARTHHEAKPVIKGLKLAANAWIHLYNFHVPNHWGCTGAFD